MMILQILKNPSFVINNMHPFLNDQLIVFARKGFSTALDTGFVSELKTDDTPTVPWIDDNSNNLVDDGEGFALMMVLGHNFIQ